MKDQEVWKANEKCQSFMSRLSRGLGSVDHCQIQLEEAFCGRVTGSM